MRVKLFFLVALCPAVLCCNGNSQDTETETTDTNSEVELDCEDLIPCEGDVNQGLQCPEDDPAAYCWNMMHFCETQHLCATFEEACLVACDEVNCNSLDTDPPIPECIQ